MGSKVKMWPPGGITSKYIGEDGPNLVKNDWILAWFTKIQIQGAAPTI